MPPPPTTQVDVRARFPGSRFWLKKVFGADGVRVVSAEDLSLDRRGPAHHTLAATVDEPGVVVCSDLGLSVQQQIALREEQEP